MAPDCSIYVTVINSTTSETLGNGSCTLSLPPGTEKWVGFPAHILPQTTASFKLVELAWLTGTAGSFMYNIYSSHFLGDFRTQQADPYKENNSVSYTIYAPPEYRLTYRTRVGNGPWRSNEVTPMGYPLYVEYTFSRVPAYRYRIIQIVAKSDYPVRNTRKELILGDHILWDSKNPNSYADGDRGSFQPNVNSYTFNKPVSGTGILYVSVEPVDQEASGLEVRLFATWNGKRVFQSKDFVLRPSTVQAYLTDPSEQSHPFSWNGDADWGMEVVKPGPALVRLGPGVSKLELYFLGETIHPAFKIHIPVDFLRVVLPHSISTITASQPNPPQAFFAFETGQIFNHFGKIYDTMQGASVFTQTPIGGYFNLEHYLLGEPGGDIGSLIRGVNCVDQAAALQLACGLYNATATSWILQGSLAHPFGFINTTHLVGVGNNALLPNPPLINVNNPFFGFIVNPNLRLQYANVQANSPYRRRFKFHVFNALSNPWDQANDVIFDATCGPHLGTGTHVQYNANVIDGTRTQQPFALAQQGPGITGTINWPLFPLRRSRNPLAGTLTEPLIAVTNQAGVLGQIYTGWASLPTWFRAALGDSWNIQYESHSVGMVGSQAFWLISHSSGGHDHQLRITATVASVVSQDGQLDVEESANIVNDCVNDILMSTQRSDVWTTGALPGLDGVSLHYADHIEAGRIVFVAGLTVMDIAGMATTNALLPIAVKLIKQTKRRDPQLTSLLAIPALKRQAIRLGINTDNVTTLDGPEAQTGIGKVIGIYARFSVIFSVSCKIATASGDCEGTGVIFDRYVVEELENGEVCNVEFIFITREVGRHLVRVAVADLETMIGGTMDLEVDVVEGTKERVGEQEVSTK
ncbi:hypothetical protein H0H92_000355 [Tricholoma furcatifolium]|nr:hypothetical protein H0H92_000355 [Tricholoma furcatifolium]